MNKLPFDANSLYYGDCLQIMQDWIDQGHGDSVNLIYLDPPFNSKANYNVLYGKENGVPAQVRAFHDTWKWDEQAALRLQRIEDSVACPHRDTILGLHTILGDSGMISYLTYMAERLNLCHQMLCRTGTLYLHCDTTAGHYLKILLDGIFGKRNFRNEIIWHYGKMSNTTHNFPNNHDVIFRYTKSAVPEECTFNPLKIDDSEYRNRFIRHLTGNQVLYGTVKNLTDKLITGRAKKVLKGLQKDDPDRQLRDSDVLFDFDEERKTHGDVLYVPIIKGNAKENLGYPTQKPMKLLEYLIQVSSNPGDLVFDPFCGCGTTVATAQKMGRKWIGVDISSFAVEMVRKHRLQNVQIQVHGIPKDLASARKLMKANAFNFEAWAISSITGLAPNQKKVGDGGIDGRGKTIRKGENGKDLVLAQVKGGGFSQTGFRDFQHVLKSNKALMGVFVTLEAKVPATARAEVARLGNVSVDGKEYPYLQFFSMEEHLEGMVPNLPGMRDPYNGQPIQPVLKMPGEAPISASTGRKPSLFDVED